MENDKTKILNENVQAAEESLTKEPKLIEIRSRVNELSDKSKELCTDIQEKLNEMSSSKYETSLRIMLRPKIFRFFFQNRNPVA